MTGVIRPGRVSRIGTSSGNIVRAGTGMNLTRATTSGGKYIRAATASLQSINSSLTLDKNLLIQKFLLKKIIIESCS